MAMGMAGFAFSGRTEHSGHIVIAFDIRLLSEIQITAIGLAFAAAKAAFKFSTVLDPA